MLKENSFYCIFFFIFWPYINNTKTCLVLQEKIELEVFKRESEEFQLSLSYMPWNFRLFPWRHILLVFKRPTLWEFLVPHFLFLGGWVDQVVEDILFSLSIACWNDILFSPFQFMCLIRLIFCFFSLMSREFIGNNLSNFSR